MIRAPSAGKNDRLGNTWYINDENIANLARPEERQQDSLYGLKSVFNVLNRSIRSAGFGDPTQRIPASFAVVTTYYASMNANKAALGREIRALKGELEKTTANPERERKCRLKLFIGNTLYDLAKIVFPNVHLKLQHFGSFKWSYYLTLNVSHARVTYAQYSYYDIFTYTVIGYAEEIVRTQKDQDIHSLRSYVKLLDTITGYL
ncbi:hypothetical protein V8E54_006863 [Elaphomyces granulatus]